MTTNKATTTATIIVVLSLLGSVPFGILLLSGKKKENELSLNKTKTTFLTKTEHKIQTIKHTHTHTYTYLVAFISWDIK